MISSINWLLDRKFIGFLQSINVYQYLHLVNEAINSEPYVTADGGCTMLP